MRAEDIATGKAGPWAMKRPPMSQDFKQLWSACNTHGVKSLITGSTNPGRDHVGPSASDAS